MTEEQFSHLSATLHQAIDDEIEARIGKVVAVAEDAAEARQRTEALARKLADVTTALVAADGALAERVEELELAVRLGREGSPSSRAFRPGLLARLFPTKS